MHKWHKHLKVSKSFFYLRRQIFKAVGGGGGLVFSLLLSAIHTGFFAKPLYAVFNTRVYSGQDSAYWLKISESLERKEYSAIR